MDRKFKVGMVILKIHGLGQTLVDNQGNHYIICPENAAICEDTDYRDGKTPNAEEVFVGGRGERAGVAFAMRRR